LNFNTKRDTFFKRLWIAIIVLINALFLLPLIFDEVNLTALIIGISLDVIICGFMIWIAVDISYHVKEDYLLVKGGPFKSKIKYKDITKISGNTNIWIGYRILFSNDAIEVYYKTGSMGSVVISPDNKKEFIAQLVQRNQSITIENMD